MTDKRQKLGQYGEKAAAQYLEATGYTILQTNWHCRYGELDIIAYKDETYVFIEVKTRRADSTEDSFNSITPRKRNRIIKAVYAYLNAEKLDADETQWRIDVIAVAIPKDQKPLIDHVEDALGW